MYLVTVTMLHGEQWLRNKARKEYAPLSFKFLLSSPFQLLLFAWLHLSGPGLLGVFAQCDAELPSGKACNETDFFAEADFEVSKVYSVEIQNISSCFNPGLLLFLRVLRGVRQSQAV